MRINRFIALATGLSRRAADKLVDSGEIIVNGRPIRAGQTVTDSDRVSLRGNHLAVPKMQTIMLNKPAGYVCSRTGQGSRTIYDLLPPELQQLKPVGRLDKDSAGLLLLTNDGELANRLTHPRYSKEKVYEIEVDKPLQSEHWQLITGHGIMLNDGLSRFSLTRHDKDNYFAWTVTMHEGRNRQIRRTFEALGYHVRRLHRTQFGNYQLGQLTSGKFQKI